ncbi:MAG: alpha/beta hydrolase [Clostridiales bacterium]|nr:alpha/beta hydrolase [Clostridiales bacterium]
MGNTDLRPTITGEGESILLLHGVISDAAFFADFASFLSPRYRTVAYDRTGYGEQAEPEDREAYTVSSQAETAADVIREYCGGKAWVFGNSAGGMIALELYRIHPELVRGLILLEPSFGLDPDSEESLRGWNTELNTYIREGRIKKALPAFARVTGNVGSSDSSLREMKRTYKNLHNFMFGELNEVQSYRPEESFLKSISVPVRIVLTEDGADRLFGKTSARAAERLHWRTSFFPGGHNAVHESPESCAEILIGMLEEMKNAG